MKLENLSNTTSLGAVPTDLATRGFSSLLANFSMPDLPDPPPWHGGKPTSDVFDQLQDVIERAISFLVQYTQTNTKLGDPPLRANLLPQKSTLLSQYPSVLGMIKGVPLNLPGRVNVVYPASAAAAAPRKASGVYGFSRPPSVYEGFDEQRGCPLSVYGFDTTPGFEQLVHEKAGGQDCLTPQEGKEASPTPLEFTDEDFEALATHQALLFDRAQAFRTLFRSIDSDPLDVDDYLDFCAQFQIGQRHLAPVEEDTSLENLRNHILLTANIEQLIGVWAAMRTLGITSENLTHLRQAFMSAVKKEGEVYLNNVFQIEEKMLQSPDYKLSPKEKKGLQQVFNDIYRFILSKDLVTHFFNAIIQAKNLNENRISTRDFFQRLAKHAMFKDDLEIIRQFECVMIQLRELEKSNEEKISRAKQEHLNEKKVALQEARQAALDRGENPQETEATLKVKLLQLDEAIIWPQTIKAYEKALARAKKGLIVDFVAQLKKSA